MVLQRLVINDRSLSCENRRSKPTQTVGIVHSSIRDDEDCVDVAEPRAIRAGLAAIEDQFDHVRGREGAVKALRKLRALLGFPFLRAEFNLRGGRRNDDLAVPLRDQLWLEPSESPRWTGEPKGAGMSSAQ
jgi:hypothetical protein